MSPSRIGPSPAHQAHPGRQILLRMSQFPCHDGVTLARWLPERPQVHNQLGRWYPAQYPYYRRLVPVLFPRCRNARFLEAVNIALVLEIPDLIPPGVGYIDFEDSLFVKRKESQDAITG